MCRKLKPEELRRTFRPEALGFTTTEELAEPADVIADQERATFALKRGLVMGHNVVAVGPRNVGRMTLAEQAACRFAAEQPPPPDYVYVANFAEAEKPRHLELPAGTGSLLVKAMDDLAGKLPDLIAQAFGHPGVSQVRSEVVEHVERLRQQASALAQKEGFQLRHTESGPEWASVTAKTPSDSLQDAVAELYLRSYKFQREADEKLRPAIAKILLQLLEKELGEIIQICGQPVSDFVKEMADDLTGRIVQVMRGSMPIELLLRRYKARLMSGACKDGAPVVILQKPTYDKLVGAIEHIPVKDGDGAGVMTDHNLIKPGALHEANGGCLIIDLRDLLTSPGSYEALKLALKSGEISVCSLGQMMGLGLIHLRGLEPEPIPLDVKVILVGDPWLCYLLEELDPDFKDLFRTRAEFVTTANAEGAEEMYVNFVNARQSIDRVLPLSARAVAALIEHGSRMAGSQEKVSLCFGEIDDLLNEASVIARDRSADVVDAEDIQQAIADRIYRLNALEERLRELITDGTIMVDVSGELVGQINGLSVLQLPGHQFGTPSRITARTWVGKAGVVSVDREAHLSGSIYDKGVMILGGYLGGTYGQHHPLSLTATIASEQSYGKIDGDSGTAAELAAIISSLSEIPIKQGIAVTGSMDQLGRIQAIGGVNHKVEGHFDVCRLMEGGLTGEQGVIIPEANAKDLMLRHDVIEAVRQGRFHIWIASTFDDVIARLTGREAGERQEDGTYPEGTVHRAAADKLAQFARASQRKKDES